MNRLFVIWQLFVLTLSSSALGQDSDPTLKPQPPFLSAIPDNTTWTINVTNALSSSKLLPGVKIVSQLVNTKSDNAHQFVSIWTDGSQSEIWTSNGYRIEQRPDKEIMVTPLPGNHESRDVDFPDLRWLSLSNYVDVEVQNGHRCWHFGAKIKFDEQHMTVGYSADIDVKTKLPVVWDVGSNHFKLDSITPSQPPIMPSAFSSALEAYKAAAAVPNLYKK